MTDLLKEGPLPLYYQLKEIIVNGINSGQLKPGNKIASELDYTKKFNISRSTVRQAISELIIDGYLYRIRGKGTFVSPKKINEWSAEDLTSLTLGIEERGIKYKIAVLEHNVIEADDAIAMKLHIKNKSMLFELKRLTTLKNKNNEPLALSRLITPLKFYPDISNEDFSKESFHKTIKDKYKLEIVKADRYFEAINATQEDADMLNVPKGSPIMYCEIISFLKNNTPIELTYVKWVGSKSRFHVHLGEK